MSRTTTHRSQRRAAIIAVFATLVWLALVAFVAAERGAERRMTFDGASH
jgi:hypothetical protein